MSLAGIATWLIGTSVGRWVLAVLVAVIALGVAYLWFYHNAYAAGAAGVTAAAAAEAVRRTARAQQARAAVKPNDQEDMARDPNNRDRAR